MWKLHNFFVTHILREINCGNHIIQKSAILVYLEFKDSELRAPKMAKKAVLVLPDSSKLISRKIRVTEKFLRFSHCVQVQHTYK